MSFANYFEFVALKEGLCKVLIAELLSQGAGLKKWQIKSFLRMCMGMCWESVLSKGNLWQVLI